MRVELAKDLDKVVQDTVLEGARQTCRRIRCPQHGKTPTVTGARKTPKGFSFEIHGCCDEVVERARQAIAD